MTIFKATVEIFVNVRNHAEACDAISESLREHLPQYALHPELTCWVDWRHQDPANSPVIATDDEIASLERHEPEPENFALRMGTSLPIFSDGFEYWVIVENSSGKEVGNVPFRQSQGETDRVAYEQRKEEGRQEALRLVAKMNGNGQ